LGLVLAAAQEVYPSQEVKEAFRNLQMAAGTQCLDASTMTYFCKKYSKTIISLGESLPLSLDEEGFLNKIKGIPGQCEMFVKECNEAITGMTF
jgi:hypothetical protein